VRAAALLVALPRMYGKGRWRADDRMIQINAAALLPLTMAHGI